MSHIAGHCARTTDPADASVHLPSSAAHEAGSGFPLQSMVVGVLVFVVVAAGAAVVEEDVVQPSHIAGHCFRASSPRSGLLHLPLYVVWQTTGSGNPLHWG